jgi:divalent metal cation (Fe/Co/Zn/Cd) transporter
VTWPAQFGRPRTRALDGTDPKIIKQIQNVALHVPKVKSVGEVRARWLGHRLHVEVGPAMSVLDAHGVANEFRHQLMHRLSYVSLVVVHVDPVDASGESHHKIDSHTHDGLPAHSHV